MKSLGHLGIETKFYAYHSPSSLREMSLGFGMAIRRMQVHLGFDCQAEFQARFHCYNLDEPSP